MEGIWSSKFSSIEICNEYIDMVAREMTRGAFDLRRYLLGGVSLGGYVM